MSLTERIYGKETAGKPAVSSDTQKNLYTVTLWARVNPR